MEQRLQRYKNLKLYNKQNLRNKLTVHNADILKHIGLSSLIIINPEINYPQALIGVVI